MHRSSCINESVEWTGLLLSLAWCVHLAMSHPWEARLSLPSPSPLPPQQRQQRLYLRFWYQVLTCVSVRLSEAASSMRSWTLRYFWRSKLRSSCASWWSVKAVRAFLGFLSRTWGLSLLLEISRSPSSFTGGQTRRGQTKIKSTRERWGQSRGVWDSAASVCVWTGEPPNTINLSRHSN